MQFESILLLNFITILIVALAAWLLSLPLRDASVMDVFWGIGFVLLAWSSLLAGGADHSRMWLLVILTTCWGLRLAGYLTWRKWGQPEDSRYAALRRSYGDRFWLTSLAIVFGLQGVILWVVALPLATGTTAKGVWNWLDVLGICIWTVGFLFEVVGDAQLAMFKANTANHGLVCDRGLWRYTRHPNYFGDFLIWWGVFLVTAAGGGGWWAIISPILMSILLLRVSGVTLLEKSMMQRKVGYGDYVSRTNAFFPWPPRR